MEEILDNQKSIEKRMIYLENDLINKPEMESVKLKFTQN